MSNTQFAFINRNQVPDRKSLQAAIDQLGFDLQLHPDFTPFEDSGFSPCTFKGVEGAGFEISYDEAAELIDEDEELAALADGKDYCISLEWHSSMKDLACAMIVSTALAKYFDAIISYEGDEPESIEELLEGTAEAIELAMNEDEDSDEYSAPENSSSINLNVNEYDIEELLATPNFYLLNRQRMALMELWANGTITPKQRADMDKIDAALHKLKNQ